MLSTNMSSPLFKLPVCVPKHETSQATFQPLQFSNFVSCQESCRKPEVYVATKVMVGHYTACMLWGNQNLSACNQTAVISILTMTHDKLINKKGWRSEIYWLTRLPANISNINTVGLSCARLQTGDYYLCSSTEIDTRAHLNSTQQLN